MKKIIELYGNGHGVNTPGKCSPDQRLREYKKARELVRDIVAKRRAMGYDARILVPEDTDVSLTERCRRVNTICNQYGKDNVILFRYIAMQPVPMANGKQPVDGVSTLHQDKLNPIYWRHLSGTPHRIHSNPTSSVSRRLKHKGHTINVRCLSVLIGVTETLIMRHDLRY